MEATIYLLLEGSACIANLLPDGPLLIIFRPKTPLTPVFKPRIVELSISAIAEEWLSMDGVKRFTCLKEDSGIMAQRKRHRKNRTGSFSDDSIGYMRRYM